MPKQTQKEEISGKKCVFAEQEKKKSPRIGAEGLGIEFWYDVRFGCVSLCGDARSGCGYYQRSSKSSTLRVPRSFERIASAFTLPEIVLLFSEPYKK